MGWTWLGCRESGRSAGVTSQRDRCFRIGFEGLKPLGPVKLPGAVVDPVPKRLPLLRGNLKTVMPHFRPSIHTTHDATWRTSGWGVAQRCGAG